MFRDNIPDHVIDCVMVPSIRFGNSMAKVTSEKILIEQVCTVFYC